MSARPAEINRPAPSAYNQEPFVRRFVGKGAGQELALTYRMARGESGRVPAVDRHEAEFVTIQFSVRPDRGLPGRSREFRIVKGQLRELTSFLEMLEARQ